MSAASTPRVIAWYRTPLEPAVLKHLHERSDARGLAQACGCLAVLATTFSLAWYSAAHWPWPVTVGLIFLHGMVSSFHINAVHELIHGTVFRTRWLHGLFVRLFAFLGWINYVAFEASHARHHRYTLHPPDDLEVVLPIKLKLISILTRGIVNVQGFVRTLKDLSGHIRGQAGTRWTPPLFPKSDPLQHRAPIVWAWTVVIGHVFIAGAAIYSGHWLILPLVTFAGFIGNWLFLLCNETQHIGLQDNVPDFRLCCRTFLLNPVVRFLYWHMNFHTEHHMYAAVPCYRLGELHRRIRHDLPPCPRGIWATWREIAAILKKQAADPTYQYIAPLPARAPSQ